MGKHESIIGEHGLPVRRVVTPCADGGERELWVLDTSDPEVQARIKAQAHGLNTSPSAREDLEWIMAVQADTWSYPEERGEAR